jgi:hypothetical protein
MSLGGLLQWFVIVDSQITKLFDRSMTALDSYTNEQQNGSRYCLQYEGQYIKPNKGHFDSWDEVEKEQVKDWTAKLKESKDGPDSLSKVLWQFVCARAVITLLDGRHRYTVTRST